MLGSSSASRGRSSERSERTSASVRRRTRSCAWSRATTGFFLICHDDVAPEPGALRLMVEELYRSNAGAVGPKLVDWDDSSVLQAVGLGMDRFGEIDPVIEPGEVDQEQHDGVRDVFVLPSAYLLVRADLFRELGGFDPAIDFYGEDTELCWRIHHSGARVVVVPSARVRHLGQLRQRRPDLRHGLMRARHRMRSVATLTGASRLPARSIEMVLLTLVELVVGLFTARFGQAWNSFRALLGLVPADAGTAGTSPRGEADPAGPRTRGVQPAGARQRPSERLPAQSRDGDLRRIGRPGAALASERDGTGGRLDRSRHRADRRCSVLLRRRSAAGRRVPRVPGEPASTARHVPVGLEPERSRRDLAEPDRMGDPVGAERLHAVPHGAAADAVRPRSAARRFRRGVAALGRVHLDDGRASPRCSSTRSVPSSAARCRAAVSP